ncbi:MAG: T9SS type A sorting domain-containing protein [Thermaurantimonas sp.]|uniref:T9SS type A sorting domain-containing protein n=1 Tax=Thermaurantimonas sp. TaxID=2681568 RepID=UPI00391CB83A
MKKLIFNTICVILFNFFLTSVFSQEISNKNTYLQNIIWGNILTIKPSSLASEGQIHYATWERLTFVRYAGRPAVITSFFTDENKEKGSSNIISSLYGGHFSVEIYLHSVRNGQFLNSRKIRAYNNSDFDCYLSLSISNNLSIAQWHNSFCGVQKFLNDSLIFGIDTINSNEIYATVISGKTGLFQWIEYIYPLFDAHQLNPDDYTYQEFFIRQDSAHVIYVHRQDASQKVRLVFSHRGFEKLYMEQHPYDRHWYFPEPRFTVKRRVIYEQSSIFDGKADGTLDIFDDNDRRILSFSLANWADEFSFLPEYVFWERDHTLSICYRYRRKGSHRVFTGLINIDLQGQVNWCMDYWLPDFRVTIRDIIKTQDGGFFMVLEQLGVTYHLMKTDRFGRVYESRNGITYTRSNCEYGDLRRRADMLLFPNPARGRFTLQTGEYGLLQIVNLAGQVVFTTEIRDHTSEVLIGHLPAGMYIVRFIGQSGFTASEKLVLYQ